MATVINTSGATPPAPTARPKPPEVTAVTTPTRIAGDDYAKPGVLGTVTTVNAIGKSLTAGGAQAGAGALTTFWSALKQGVKANALVAGALSVVTNGYDMMKGRETLKQFLGLSVADTVAYTGIGVGATAAGATLAPLLVAAVPAIAFAGPALVIGIAASIGILGSMLYGKLGHDNIKAALK